MSEATGAAARFAALCLLAAAPLLCLGPLAMRRRDATGPSPDAEGACMGSDLGLLLRDRAPECLRACPSLCPHAIPAVAGALEDGRARPALCAHRAALACAAGAEACAPALALAPRAVSAAGSPAELEALCSGSDDVAQALSQPQQGGPLEFSAGALSRRGGAGLGDTGAVPLERSLQEKEIFPDCVGKGEGWNCMPPNGSAHSNSKVYCTQGKYQLPSTHISYCPELSRCYGYPAQCDDPFCRNGEASHGDGRYCHNGMIVRCTGDNAPVTEDACFDRRTQLSSSCTRVTDRYCVQRGSSFFCEDGDGRLEGNCDNNDDGWW